MAKNRGIGRGNNTKNQPITRMDAVRGKDKAKLNRFQKEELITKIIEWLLAKANKLQIKEQVLVHAPVLLNDGDAYELIKQAIVRIEEITKQDAHIVINSHIDMYRDIAAYFEKVGRTDSKNKALRAIEKLSGLHSKKNRVEFNTKKTTVIEREVEYDTSRLSEPEKVRMEFLLNKMK